MNKKSFDLIICEKDQQGRDIAEALNIHEVSFEIRIPSKDLLRLKEKVKAKKKKIERKQKQIDLFVEKRVSEGKGYKDLKRFTDLQTQSKKWTSELLVLENNYSAVKENLEKRNIIYWKNESKVLISCTGHLLSIKLKNRNNHLNFETDLSAPSPTNPNEVSKWMKLKLIRKYLNVSNLDRIICAMDFDREGECIFGSIMEYYGVDLTSCFRMKFSTLEIETLKKAYINLIRFNIDLYDSGKLRRWMDFVIGFNLSPLLGRIYRRSINSYLLSLDLSEDSRKRIIYNQTFNIGRVKLVIMNYIFQHTKEQLKRAQTVINCEADGKEQVGSIFSFNDNDKVNQYLFSEDFLKRLDKDFSIDDPLKVEITKIEYREVYKDIGNVEVPSFLNLTKVFQLCSRLGASTNEINRVLEYLYLQKYLSYPRSKSERWEIEEEKERSKYALSVLNSLQGLGYPIKEYYYESYGNEGDVSHSHPCIHPLPSITFEKVERLKRINPLAFLVFNEIVIFTLKCFEKLPKIKEQEIYFKVKQDDRTSDFTSVSNIDLIDENILTFEGFSSSTDFAPKVSVNVGEVFDVSVEKSARIEYSLNENRRELEICDDFKVIDFLNANDIGTDATRSVILNELIELQYLVSNNVLLTTYLGNTLNKLSNSFIEFINIEYTLEMEHLLNQIENTILSGKEFKQEIETIVTDTYNNILEHENEIERIFLDVPDCEVHKTSMIIKSGRFGKFLQCPHFYTEEKCNQKYSI